MDETAKNEWQRIRSVFEDVLLQPAEERPAYAQKMCGNDESLWNEVRSLLEWHESSESFLETPAVVQVAGNSQLPNQLIAGQRLLHYEIRKLIGKGGMGEVYLARDTKLDRNVAVKLLRGDLLPHVRASERLLREARAAALLEHPNICHVHEISEADGFNFIVMQYVVGMTLDDILSGRGIDVDNALDLGAQIAEGLSEAHSQGIIHRDIKPANIIVSEKGQAKILDFGLAKSIEGEANFETAQQLTNPGAVMGTVPYMSPEQLRGKTADARSDVFAFGALLYEMLSGTPAYKRESNAETISAILNGEPDWTPIPDSLQAILQKCLAKDADQRFNSAGEVLDALREARKHGNFADGPTTTTTSLVSPVRTHDEPTVPTQSGLSLRQFSDPIQTDNEIVHAESGHSRRAPLERINNQRAIFCILAVLSAGVVALGFLYSGSTLTDPPDEIGHTAKPELKRYWDLTEVEKRDFIRDRIIHIQRLIGDDAREIRDESIEGIKHEIDWYVSRRDSLSQEPFKEGLRSVYGRASQYVPLVSAEFDKEKVPVAIGIYQAIVESEYRDCLVSDTGPVGIFQFTKATAIEYGLASKDRCRVDLSSAAAAAYISNLISYFGSERSSWTLAVLSFNQGEDLTRLQIRKLRLMGLTERNYWAISENRERFVYYNPDSDRYMRRFFAATIIGETPATFDLVTPPLSTIRFASGESTIELKCEKGCAWETLSYACEGKTQCSAIVDELGVRGIESAIIGETPPSWIIRIQSRENAVEMKCEKGCAWETLSYSCDGKKPCSAIVNERGLRDNESVTSPVWAIRIESGR